MSHESGAPPVQSEVHHAAVQAETSFKHMHAAHAGEEGPTLKSTIKQKYGGQVRARHSIVCDPG